MKLKIENMKDSIIFIAVLTLVLICIAIHGIGMIPPEWSLFKRILGGLIAGIFFGLIVTTSRIIGAYDGDESHSSRSSESDSSDEILK